MDEKKLIEQLHSLVGRSISHIHYIKTNFHHDVLSGDWTNVNPDMFLLHSPEWKLQFADGGRLFITNPQGAIDKAPKCNLTIANHTIKIDENNVLSVPEKFYWQKIIGKPIKKFRIWKRIMKSTTVLGYEFNKKYENSVQIVEILISEQVVAITAMNGDLGHLTFYPNGYMGDRVGIYFNKAVAELVVVYGHKIRMEITYQSL